MINIGDSIRKRRAHLKMTRKDFAELVGVRRQTLAFYEYGTVCPSFDVVQIMAEKLGMRISEFIDVSEIEEWEVTKEYALYKGDDILAIGTPEDIAKKLGIKRSSVMGYHSNYYSKTCKTENHRVLVEI